MGYFREPQEFWEGSEGLWGVWGGNSMEHFEGILRVFGIYQGVCRGWRGSLGFWGGATGVYTPGPQSPLNLFFI